MGKKKSRAQARGLKQRPSDQPAAVPFSLSPPSPGALLRAGLWFLTLLALFVSPLPRGLYFPAEHLTATIVLVTLFALYWLARTLRGDPPWRWQLLDWAVLGVVLAYALSTLVAANLRAAVGEALKFGTYLAAYWLVAGQATGARQETLLDVVVGSGSLVTLLGLAAFTGLAEVQGAVIWGRLASTLQYPNTLAAYLTAILFLALARREQRGPSPWRHLYTAAGLLLAVGILLTLSRGGILVLPLAAAIFLVALPPGRRLSCTVQLALLVGLGTVVAALVGRAAGDGPAFAAWAWLVAGGAAAVAGSILLEAPRRAGARARRTAAGVAAAALVGLALRFGADLLRAVSSMGRLVAISGTDANVLQRMVYNQDGLRIALSRPLLGAGGGGWEALYHAYQSYPYFSAHVHNFLLEHWISTGTLGLLTLLACWLAFAASAVRLAGRHPHQRVRLAGLLAACLALGLHSLIDVNLALPALGLLPFTFFGLVRASGEEGGGGRHDRHGAALRRAATPAAVGAIVTSLVVVVVAALLLQGQVCGRRGIAFLMQERYEEARAAFERARSADPLTASFAMDLATCYETLGTWRADGDLIARAREQMQAALRLEPYNSSYHHCYGVFEYRMGRLKEGLSHLERSVDLFPAMAPYYGNLARAYVLAGLQELAQGKGDGATACALQALKLEEQALARSGNVPGFVPGWLQMKVPDAVLSLSVGQACVLLGRYEEGLDRLVRVDDKAYPGEAAVWAAVAFERLGRPEAAELVAALEQTSAELADLHRRLREVLLPDG